MTLVSVAKGPGEMMRTTINCITKTPSKIAKPSPHVLTRLNHSDQPTAAQTVAGTHPMGTGNQMDIEPILDRNTNDNLVPAKFKSDQVKTDCEK